MKIIIIGGGFGGLTTAKSLAKTNATITIIDRTNYHLFQPLLYQVATAALAPGDIAVPIRSVFSRQSNVNVLMGEVTAIDRAEKKVLLSDGGSLHYDILVMAPGARHSYFGNNKWEVWAPGLKTLSDALDLREHLLKAYETAENMKLIAVPLPGNAPAPGLSAFAKTGSESFSSPDSTRETDTGREQDRSPGQQQSHFLTKDDAIRPWLTFVVVGGGPTGVELAGAIAEISRKTMMKDFRRISPEMTRIYLVEARDQILSSYSEKLSKKAKKSLERLGVDVLTGVMVKDVSADGVTTPAGFIPAKTIIWAAGNQASPLLQTLHAEYDRAGRVLVRENLTLPEDPDVFVIGDAAAFRVGDSILPGIAPVAMQQGRFVAGVIRNRLKGSIPANKFVYNDKGMMATIGRGKAVAEIGSLKLSGLPAWLMWSFVHIFFLIGFRNRFRVMIEWIWYYITFKGGFRLITGVKRREFH
jgi:NADH:ubiquinone reductase (H+-translocating)